MPSYRDTIEQEKDIKESKSAEEKFLLPATYKSIEPGGYVRLSAKPTKCGER